VNDARVAFGGTLGDIWKMKKKIMTLTDLKHSIDNAY
jgi:hypothetical protein